jgi:serine/threonine protein phosphatase PrpC
LNSNDDSQGKVSSATGCTANVILITKDSYFVANAGDSRSALARGKTCVQLSEDHKPESV